MSEFTRADGYRALWWASTFVALALAHLVIVWVLLALSVVFFHAIRWGIRADREQRLAAESADEIAAIRKFHESLDGTIDMILRRGK
jgi:hypothetical protein